MEGNQCEAVHNNSDNNDDGDDDSEKNNDAVPNWKDITQEFLKSTKDLELGELLHDSNFGLFEAMSAIEMMDPKMDAGMMCNQAKRKVLNFKQSVESEAIKIDNLDASESMAIIDDTMACMVTWLEGHSLAQTVFTNLYLHEPFLIEDRPLKAFSICALKTVDLIRDRINRANVFEEEDFQTMTYGFNLACEVSEMRACGMMKEAEDELQRRMKNTRSRVGEKHECGQEQEHELASGLHARLRFCRLFYSTLLLFNREKYTTLSDASKQISQLVELLPVIKRTLPLSLQPPPKTEAHGDYATIPGFEPLVNQRLLPPTFPRYTQISSREDTWEYMESLLARLCNVCQITDITYLHTALEFFEDFSISSPCVLSRSLLQLVLLPESRRFYGTANQVDVLRDTIRTFIAAPALTQKTSVLQSPQVKECVDGFLCLATRPLCRLFLIPGHNRARQRDKYAHLLEELASLQDEADKVDSFLHNLLKKVDASKQHLACFGNWVLYHTLRTMIAYCLGGFELELYSTHEYHYIFWYLYECIYNWLISTLSRADTFLAEQENMLEQQKGRKANKNKKKKKTSPHAKQIIVAQATQNLCAAYYRLIVGLELDGKLKKPKFDFDSEEVRYNHRFAPFGNVATPPPVQYPHFKEMTDLSKYSPPPEAEDMYSWAGKCFQQAKVQFEQVPQPNQEVLTLIKIAKTNFVVAKLLHGGHKKDSKEPPEFEFILHKMFPVIKL